MTKLRASLKRKLLLPMVSVLTLGGALLLWAIAEKFDRQRHEETHERAFLVAQMVNYAADSVSRAGELQRIVTALGAEKELLDVVVVGGTPTRVLASTKNAWLGKLLPELPGEEVAHDLEQALVTGKPHSHYNEKEKLYDYSAPLLLGDDRTGGVQLVKGAVMVHLDTRQIEAAVARTRWMFSGGLVAAMMVMAAFGYWLINRTVLKPIGAIDKLLRFQTPADAAEWQQVATGDEVGEHAKTLRQTLEASSATMRALELQTNQLGESERRFRFMLETCPTAARIARAGGHEVIFSNSRYAELINIQHGMASGLDPASYYAHPADYADILQCLKRGEQIFDRLVELNIPGIGTKWAVASYLPIQYQGEPAVLGWFHDVTDSKQSELAIRDQVEHTQAIINNMVDGVITIDRKGLIASFNPAAEQIFGYARDEVMGRNVNMLMPSPYRDRHDDYLRNYQASGVAKIIGIGREVEGQRKDGSLFPMDLAVAKITRQGEVMYVGMVRDITERKRVERMKSEFVSTVSHELRTPLTSISGALGLITGGALGEMPQQAQQMLGIAHKNSLRLTYLINDLLDMEKLVAGKMRFDVQLQPLVPLVEQAVELNRTYGGERSVTLALLGTVADGEVRVDGQRLMQVLNNFISNAIKYSPEGGTVEIFAEERDGAARITVRDHGPGIPTEFRSRIFQKFSQADSSDTRQKGGTGLGLAISRELVERMGGTIGFESVEGQGASFWCEFPLPHKHVTASQAPRILVVEDEADIAQVLAEMLTRAGYAVDIVANGKDALRAVEDGSYAAVTLDLMLPDIGGLEIIHRLRQNPSTARLPIVVVSAKMEEGRLAINGAFSNIEWLAKPMDEAHLLSALQGLAPCRDSATLRVLHVEDDLDLHKVVRATVGDHFDFRLAPSVGDARVQISRESFDVVLLDMDLPDGAGWELLPEIRASQAEARVVILSGGEANPEHARKVEAVLLKSRTSPDELLAALSDRLGRLSS